MRAREKNDIKRVKGCYKIEYGERRRVQRGEKNGMREEVKERKKQRLRAKFVGNHYLATKYAEYKLNNILITLKWNFCGNV